MLPKKLHCANYFEIQYNTVLYTESRVQYSVLPGSLFSHASAHVARNLAFVQCSRVRDLVILRSWQNQHLSSLRFLIRLKQTAERQWTILIWAAVLAMAFPVRSRQDFLGGSGGISSSGLSSFTESTVDRQLRSTG